MDTRKAFLGVGWAMPVDIDPQTGFIATVAYEDDIRQAILIILETAPGERVMRPDFGCGIHDMVFEAMDSTTIERIRSVVADALRKYEARIEVLNVTVDEDADVLGQVLIELEYQVRRTNQIGNLVFPFYFKEGGGT
jgi:phage baseplate assembly protein W